MSEFTKTIKISLSSQQLAETYWDMTADEQAQFLIELGEIWKGEGFNVEKQMLSVKECLNEDSRGETGIEALRKMSAWVYLAVLGEADLYAAQTIKAPLAELV